SGRKANPCDKLSRIQQSCLSYDNDEPAEMTVAEIQKWATWQVCKNAGSCNHRGCFTGEKVIEFLATVSIRKAA
ncbi:hypothetical protein ACI3PL_20695, partial [Lacticaseibacillus paracasei]